MDASGGERVREDPIREENMSLVDGLQKVGSHTSAEREGRFLHRMKRWAIPPAVFLVVFAVHVLSEVKTSYDSRWSVYVAMSILAEGNTDLDEYEEVISNKGDYAIEKVNGRKYDLFPVGTPLLAAPFVGAIDICYRAVRGYGLRETLERGRTSSIERFIASVVVAACAVLVYAIAKARRLGVWKALLLVFLFAFCTSAWSVASRALWQHGPSMLMLTLALYLLLLAERRPNLVQFAALPLAFSYVVRPTNCVPAVILCTFVLLSYRRHFLRFVLWGMVVAVPFIVFNLVVYGRLLSVYYLPRRLVGSPHVLEALAGNLVSPARGLFVYSPVLVFALLGVVFKIRSRRIDRLDGSLTAIILLHWLLISSFPHWWAGASYGPRFFCDVIPFFVYLLIPVLERLRRPTRGWGVVLVSTFFLLTAMSFLVHFRGAMHASVWRWNATPIAVDQKPGRVWDWTDIPFLRREQ